jgi:hypothetical protein
MVLLDKEHYEKVIEPLKSVAINHLFARAVVEKMKDGKIYVDSLKNPKTFYVIEAYGMSLLFGDWTNSVFNNKFKEYALNHNNIRDRYEWMQTFPDEWNDTLTNLFGMDLVDSVNNKKETRIIELNTRVNFKFSHEKYANRKKIDISGIEIVKTDANVFRNMPGSVTPKYFWDDADDFLKNGMGYSLFYNRQLAATAFSSCKIGDLFEIGVETKSEFQGKGFAQIVCCALIDYCIENTFTPIWSCRLANTASYTLAQKVGFEVAYEKPYYRLSK